MKFNKKIILAAAIIFIAAFAIYLLQKPKGPTYKTAKVTRGAITQEISETGTIKKGDPINLNFKNSGTIAKINVATGQAVITGQVLAEQDTAQLNLQLAQARANLKLYQSQMAKLHNGASAEEIAISLTNEQNYRSALESARQSLANVQTTAAQNLASSYDSATNALNAAYAKAYNAQNYASLVQRTYFTPRNDDSILAWELTQKMDLAVGQIKSSIDTAESSGNDENFDSSMSLAQARLGSIAGWLQDIRAICEKTAWRDIVSATDKNGLDTQRDYVIAAQTAVNSSRQSVISQKTANETAVNAARAVLTAAEGNFKTSQEQLAKLTGAPRAEDISASEAQAAGALAQVNLLELQINDSRLKAPVDGQVIEVNARIGETSQPLLAATGAVVILPGNLFEVEADIYEEDVAKAKVNDPVAIMPVATPDVTYKGKVISIDPSGTLVNGVVYYTTTIGFDETPTGLKPKMTADIVITTASNANALQIAEAAVQKNNAGYFVQVLENGKMRDIAVQTGIISKGQAEIVSGLSGNEEVIIP